MSEKEFLAEELKALLPPNAVIVSGDEYSKLKKEVEELKRHNTEQASIKHDLRVEITELTKELTRLRELLAEAREEISSGYMTQSEKKKLLEEIDNALNPKP